MRLRIAVAIVLYGALVLIVWALSVDWFATLLALGGAFGVVTATIAYKGIREAARRSGKCWQPAAERDL